VKRGGPHTFISVPQLRLESYLQTINPNSLLANPFVGNVYVLNTSVSLCSNGTQGGNMR
jgi:hypothetical protein